MTRLEVDGQRGPQAESAEAAPAKNQGASALWLGLLAVAVLEMASHVAIRSGVAAHQDWVDAAAYVRKHFRPGDAITVTPAWADPVLRWVLGDRISLSMAGRSDLDAYGRLWGLSIRGAVPEEIAEDPGAKGSAAEMSRQFGRVQVRRWLLPPRTVVFDLVENVRRARVTLVRRGVERECPWQRLGLARGGGLGAGVVPPEERFVCDASRRWLWVAPVVVEDLSLKPRRCVWQHPAGPEPLRVTYSDVPLAERLVFYGGLYYEDERDRQGGLVEVKIRVNGRAVGGMLHRDGDGWKRIAFATGGRTGAGERGDITVEVSAQRPHRRGFCWAASLRKAGRHWAGPPKANRPGQQAKGSAK